MAYPVKAGVKSPRNLAFSRNKAGDRSTFAGLCEGKRMELVVGLSWGCGMARTTKRASVDVAHRPRRVLSAIADGPQTTAGLAAAVGATRGQVYGDCSLLEQLGWVASELVRGPVKLFFCPTCGKVVTQETYAECEGALRPFYPKVRRWSLTLTGRTILKRAGSWPEAA
jgi:hypothetical protein